MMNWRNVTEMDYTELACEELVIDMEQWTAQKEGDLERANDLYTRLVELRNELDKRELAVREEEAAEERAEIDAVMEWAFNEACDMIEKEAETMTENLICALRKNDVDFYVNGNRVFVINDDGFELTAICGKDTIAMHGVAGSKIHEGHTSIFGFVAAARDWLA